MIPLATTTIDVLRLAEADRFAEPYSGDTLPRRTTQFEGVRAVIQRQSNRSSGIEQNAGGEQSITDLELTADLIDLKHTDLVRDNSSDIVYRVVWVISYPGEHTEAGLRRVEGLV